MSYTHIDAIDDQGRRREAFVARSSMPGLGEWFTDDDGTSLQRVPSATRVHVTENNDIKAWSLPRRDRAKKMGLTMAPHYDSQGVARFQSRREVDEYTAKVNDNPKEGKKLAWNPDGNE